MDEQTKEQLVASARTGLCIYHAAKRLLIMREVVGHPRILAQQLDILDATVENMKWEIDYSEVK